MSAKPLLVLVLLAGCQTGGGQGIIEQQTGPARARNGGEAEVLLHACPGQTTMPAVEAALHRIVADLQAAGVLASANGGTARLTIDLCPS
jgi:hypothetical protein